MINEILDFFKTVFSGSGFFSLGCNVWNSLIAYAFDMLQTSPQSLADGELWDEGYRIFLALQILGATLVSVFFMINFFKETTDIKHGMTMEAPNSNACHNKITPPTDCTCVPQFSYEKDRRGRSVPTCRYILAVQRPKSSYSDYMYCVAFGERAMITFQRIKKGTTVFVQGHLHTEEGRDANNQKVYFVTVTVDYQQIIEKQEFNGLELCTGLPQFPVLKQEEKGGK